MYGVMYVWGLEGRLGRIYDKLGRMATFTLFVKYLTENLLFDMVSLVVDFKTLIFDSDTNLEINETNI